MADASRILLFTPQDELLEELHPDCVFERIRTEELNGEHSLRITTTKVLTKETRVLTYDTQGIWREYVVMGEDADHAAGKRAFGTYYMVWSLQHDMQVCTVSGEPGVQTPVTAGVALSAALSGTSRWTVGTVTQSTTGGASMYQRSGWEALGVLVEVWGGEISTTITVNSEGIVSRSVNLLSHEGSSTAVRRFDYSRDMTEIRRRVSEDPVYCRIIPLGKGEETDGGGYGRKIGIETATANTGHTAYIENSESAAIYKLPDGQGGYEYPTGYVENSDIDDVNELYAWGLSILDEWTTPKVTYEASVVQLAQAGMSVQGIGLGDEVHCVDTSFAEGLPLRIAGRVIKLVTNELDPSDIQVTLGNLGKGLPDLFNQLQTTVKRTRDVALAAQSGTITTAEYLDNLIANLNSEINATGGYTYIIPGQGLRTYDVAVTMGTDPVTGEPIVADDSMASKVVEIKGGSIRIADSKTAQGAWEWKTLIQSGHIASELVTSAQITTGFIGNANGDFFIDLDNHVYRMPSMAVGGTQLLDDTDAPILGRVSSRYNRYFSDASNTDTTASIVPCPDPPIVGIQNMQRYVIGVAGSKHKNLVFYSNTSVDALPYEDGETYTVSCFARVTSGAKARIEMRCSAFGVSGTAGAIEIENTEWKQYSWTKVANSSSGLFRVFVGVYSTYAATVEICGIKCERGSNATDWCLSQNDILQKSSIGENLLIDADAPTLTAVAALKNRYWSDAGRGTDIVEPYLEACSDPPQVGISNKLRFVVKQVSTYKDLVFYSNSAGIDLIDGEDYTLSFWARKTSGTQVTFNCRDTLTGTTGSGGTGRNTTITNTSWQRYQFTFKGDASKNPYRLYIGVYCDNLGTLEICGIKLEKGIFATDWTKPVNNQIFALDTQPIIFNQLTNYGAIQGLYMQNGQLYINSEYINTQALISPKVGNSATDYASIGTFTYQNKTYNGIKFFTSSGNIATMIFGVCDDAQGTYMVWGVGLPNGTYWPVYFGANGGGLSGQPTAFIQALPTQVNGNYSAPGIEINTRGVFAYYGGMTITLGRF